MILSHALFLFFFLPAVVILYLITPQSCRKYLLFVANIAFFAMGGIWPMLLAVMVLFLCYGLGRWIDRWRHRSTAKTIVYAFGISLLCLLFLSLRYLPSLSFLTGRWSNHMLLLPQFILPIGASIYLLHGISYLTDLWQGKGKVQTNPANLCQYLCFFPQMPVGPIARYSDVQNYLEPAPITPTSIRSGYSLFVHGLAKKLLLADPLLRSYVYSQYLSYDEMAVSTAWMSLVVLSLSMLMLLSGSMDMARGLGKLVGLPLPQQFHYPLSANTFAGFWRKFHISLSIWVKSYVLKPFRAFRGSFFGSVFQMLLLWLVISVWYGGSLYFLLWGLLVAGIIIVEHLFFLPLLKKLSSLIGSLYVTFLVLLTMVFFVCPNLHRLPDFFAALFGKNGWIDSFTLLHLRFYIIFCGAALLTQSKKVKRKLDTFKTTRPKLSMVLQTLWETVLLLLCLFAALAGLGQDAQTYIFF